MLFDSLWTAAVPKFYTGCCFCPWSAKSADELRTPLPITTVPESIYTVYLKVILYRPVLLLCHENMLIR